MALRRARATSALLLIVAAAGCARRWETVPPSSLPAASELRDVNAVVLLDEQRLRFNIDPRTKRPIAEQVRHFRARVLREGGEAVGKIVVFYRPGFSEALDLDARTVAADGTEHRWVRRDAADIATHAEWQLYSDNRALVLDLKPAPGTLVEYRYTVRISDLRFFGFGHRFAVNTPARTIRFEVSAPAGWGVAHVAHQFEEPRSFPPVVSEGPDGTHWTWERHDVPALKPEPLGPSAISSAETVSVRLQHWTEQGRAMDAPPDARALSASLYGVVHLDLRPSVHALAEQVTAGLPDDPRRRAQRLYAWVRDHVSYCAIEIGIGGWRPHAADEVLRVHYGDCKDKANLLRDLLASVGVHSQLVAIYSHDGFPPRLVLPARVTFNHAILQIDLPDGKILADPTSTSTAFGALPVNDQEADALPVTEAGADVLVAPSSDSEDNQEDSRVELTVDGDAFAGGFTLERTGWFADTLRASLLDASAADRSRALQRALPIVHARVLGVDLENAAPPEVPTPIRAHGRLRLTGLIAGARFVIHAADLLSELLAPLPDERRRAPLVVRCRQLRSHRVRVALAGATAGALPPATTIERPFGSYALTWSRDGDALVVERRMVLRERILPAADYASVRSFFDEIAAAESRGVTVHR